MVRKVHRLVQRVSNGSSIRGEKVLIAAKSGRIGRRFIIWIRIDFVEKRAKRHDVDVRPDAVLVQLVLALVSHVGNFEE